MVFSASRSPTIKSILATPRNGANAAGFTASSGILASETISRNPQLLKLAATILENPLLQRQLCDRVYELLQEDLRQQKERYRNYGRRF